MKTVRNLSSAFLFGNKQQTLKFSGIPLSGTVLFFIIIFSLLGSSKLYSQGVGISEVSIIPESSAILELRSTERGLLVPRMTTTEIAAIVSPAQGLMVYDINTKSFWYYESGWKAIASGDLGTGDQLLGMNAAGTANEYKTINGTPNQILVNYAPGSITLLAPQDIHSGAAPTFLGLTLSGLSADAGVYTSGTSALTSTPPSSGTIGYWNRSIGGTLSPTNAGDGITTSGNISTTGSGTLTSAGLITGAEGATISGGIISLNNNSNFGTNINTGASTGNIVIGNPLNTVRLPAFNTPGIIHNDASGVLSSSLIVNEDLSEGSVTSTKILDGTIVNADISNIAAIALSKLASGSDAQVIVGSLTGVPSYVDMSGDVTIDNTGVTTIGSSKVINGMLAGDAVTTDKIADGTVLNSDINANAQIDASKLADGTVSNAKFQFINSLTGNAQTQLDNLGTQITGINTLADGKIYLGDGANTSQEVTITGDVTIDNAGVTAIGSSKVINGMLAGDAVTTDKIADGTVLNSDINANAQIDASKLADGTVSNAKFQFINSLTGNAQTQLDNLGTQITGINTLADGKIYLGDGANTSQEVTITGDVTIDNAGVTAIGSSKVINGMLAGDAVTTDKIADGTVLNSDINANAQIDASKLADGTVSNAEFQYLDGLTDNIQDQLDSRQTTTLTDGDILVGDASNIASSVTMSGDVTINNLGVTTIGAGRVTNGMLATNAVTADKILDNAIDLPGTKVTGTLPVSKGGTGQSAELIAGGILYGASTSAAAVTAAGSSGQVLSSTGSGAPVWSTYTFPNTATSGKIMIGDGTDFVASTASYPETAGNQGSIIVSDGTNFTTGALSNSSSSLSSDITMSPANSWNTGPSISLDAGTWFITGTITITNPNGSAGNTTARLYNGSSTISSSESYTREDPLSTSISLSGIVTLLSTATISIDANGTQNNYVMRAAAVNNGEGNNASYINAIRIGP